MTIIWCMVPVVPEIWSVMDRVFCHFGLFFALPPPSPLPLKLCSWTFVVIQNTQKKHKCSLSFSLPIIIRKTDFIWMRKGLYASRLMVNNLTKLTKILTKIYFRNTGRIKNFSWYKKIWEEKKRFAKYLVVCKIF